MTYGDITPIQPCAAFLAPGRCQLPRGHSGGHDARQTERYCDECGPLDTGRVHCTVCHWDFSGSLTDFVEHLRATHPDVYALAGDN